MRRQPAGAYTDAPHGTTPAAVSPPYYHHILPYGLEKFRCCAAFCSFRAHANTGRVKVFAQHFYTQQLTANAESRRYVKISQNVLRGTL